MSRRTERLSSMIRQELAMMILHELNDPRITGLPTITRVEVAEDLSNADVFITSMGTPGQQSATLNALKHSAGGMRAKLTKMLSIRTTPFIRFHYDERLKKEMEVLALLDLANKEREEREAKLHPSDEEPTADGAEHPAQDDATNAADRSTNADSAQAADDASSTAEHAEHDAHHVTHDAQQSPESPPSAPEN